MRGNSPLPPSPYELGVRAREEGRPLDALHAFEQADHRAAAPTFREEQERGFTFEPLFCSTYTTKHRLLNWALGNLVVWAPGFGTTTPVAFAYSLTYGAFSASDVRPAPAVIVFLLTGGGACWARVKETRQRGVRLRPVEEEKAEFQFVSREYEQAFEELNRAFIVEKLLLGPSFESDCSLPQVGATSAATASVTPSERASGLSPKARG